ncbi:ATPase subunit of ABC transporter with duplicated ATPase domains [Pseudochrobactrum asaccharolyticum]|uniref:ATPase subunit of ABC transporter with duplicated ATPase domains n=2 Tax=Pseudochrobactrum asaccharolyticum TaxID=354351 RepID=A0A366E6G3_9HYPH|nr:ATPase subunit of ABC transporter with duplicated ATPase domains [Pseudochrobactrum asaccharolyticum]
MFLLFQWMLLLITLFTLHNLVAQTPDGRNLFQNLSLHLSRERTGLIGRNGTGKSTLLRIIAGEIPPAGGSLTAHGKLGFLHQIADERHETVADLFGVTEQLTAQARILAGEGSGEDLAEADWTLETRIDDALAKMGLPDLNPQTMLDTLSGGQKTRAALAALIFQEADLILLDEPTNNLDAQGREAVLQLLRNWRGGALVVSHDRTLLREMDRIVELTPIGVSTYGGNWDFYEARKAEELAAAQHDLAVAETSVKQAEKQARLIKERQEKRDSAGKKSRFSAGQSKLLLDAKADRAQATGGRNNLLALKQAESGQQALSEAQSKIERLIPQNFNIGAVSLPATKTVLTADNLTFAYHADKPVFQNLSLQITGPERIALCGRNGSGKTSLLHLLAGKLTPQQGTVQWYVDYAMLDQHVSLLDPALNISDNFKRIHPKASDNDCRAALARFMFRADAALQNVAELSGGEKLRAGLACVLGGVHAPELLILDEPTNHLDIVALQSVETALNAYQGALLITSHDEVFLNAIGITRRINLSD